VTRAYVEAGARLPLAFQDLDQLERTYAKARSMIFNTLSRTFGSAAEKSLKVPCQSGIGYNVGPIGPPASVSMVNMTQFSCSNR